MDTPLNFDSSDDSSYSDSESFESTSLDPENFKHANKVTPNPSLTELRSILPKLNLDIDNKLTLDDIKTAVDNNKPTISNACSNSISTDNNNNIQMTSSISSTKIGSVWYINQYLCYGYLGKGSFSKVALAKNILSNKKVAIKIINKNSLARMRTLHRSRKVTSMLDNIFNEIFIMKQMDHPNILKLYEVINNNTDNVIAHSCKLYMVLDYMPNGSILGSGGGNIKCDPISNHNLIRKYLRDIILGLDYMHSNNIIHGDIKPENLLLNDNHNVVLADFGCSFILNKKNCPNNDGKISKNQGTPAFTAPETVNKTWLAFPVDVWAMGVTLYMMITGICPFAVANISDARNKINPTIPDNINDNMKDYLVKILDKDPNKRITLAESIIHPWITNNNTEPLLHPIITTHTSLSSKTVKTDMNMVHNNKRRNSIDNTQIVDIQANVSITDDIKTSSDPLSILSNNTQQSTTNIINDQIKHNRNISPSFAKKRYSKNKKLSIKKSKKNKNKNKKKSSKKKNNKTRIVIKNKSTI